MADAIIRLSSLFLHVLAERGCTMPDTTLYVASALMDYLGVKESPVNGIGTSIARSR
jgi:hypothetical protein